MIDDDTINMLLRRTARDVPPPCSVSADHLHARIISGEKWQRTMRQWIGCGVLPASAAIGLVSMWIMSLPGAWIALATLANAGAVLVFYALIKWMFR